MNQGLHLVSLDLLMTEPDRIASLAPEMRRRLIQKCGTLCLLLADEEPAARETSDRMLNAAEAGGRMGKTVGWMKTQGRRLPFARKVGRSWGWVESGLVDYLKRRR